MSTYQKECLSCEGMHYYTIPKDIGVRESLESLSRFLDAYLCKQANLKEVCEIRSWQDTLEILIQEYPREEVAK